MPAVIMKNYCKSEGDDEIRKNIRTFTLYTTLEPCPLCFGAIVMGSIRNVLKLRLRKFPVPGI